MNSPLPVASLNDQTSDHESKLPAVQRGVWTVALAAIVVLPRHGRKMQRRPAESLPNEALSEAGIRQVSRAAADLSVCDRGNLARFCGFRLWRLGPATFPRG